MDVKQENTMADEEWSTIVPQKTEEEKIEIEIEGQEAEQEEPIQIEKEEPVQAQVEEKQEEQKTEEEQALEGVETSGAQKRIRQLVKQKKEREAEIQSLIDENKKMQLKLQERDEEYSKLLNTNVESNERQVTERIDLAKNAYKQALDSGDTEQIVKAQEILNNAQQDSFKIEGYKKEAETFKPTEYTPKEEQKANAEVSSEARRKAIAWTNKNEWFNKDKVLTAVALQIDEEVQNEGYDPSDDDYYEEVDRRLGEYFPNKFSGNTETPVPQETSTPAQVVAGASLAPKTSSGKKVKLTQEDVRLANKWGISLEQYAQEKLKIERAGDGGYTNIG